MLIEACLELAKTDWIVGIQDLGAAGLTSAAIESASKGGSGIDIDVLKVPRREKGMTPYEIMLSESQERMLVAVKKGYENKVKALFDRWELRSDIIGHITDDGIARIREGSVTVAEIPIHLLTETPVYRLRTKNPGWLSKLQSFDVASIPDISVKKIPATLLKLLASPNIASRHSIYRQYDHQVGNNSVVLPGSDAAVLRIQETEKAIALTTDGNGRYCYLNPFLGGVIAVAEAARNLACSGARPVALTNCLNFGNPEKNDVYYQLKECINGMARACRTLKVPVVSGNVSLYNETKDAAIYPTPVIGMVGLIDDVHSHCTYGFKNKGDIVYLLGTSLAGDSSLGGSEYLSLLHGLTMGNLTIDLELEKRLHHCCIELIERGIISSAHDCSEGGLLVCLAESCIAHGIGFSGANWRTEGRLDAALFGEAQSRIIISLQPRQSGKLEKIAAKYQVPATRIGTAGGNRLTLKGYINISLDRITKAWLSGLGE